MSNAMLNTKTASFDELIAGEKVYSVPPFQRDYSWENEEWEDLWLDIRGLMEGEEHFPGVESAHVEETAGSAGQTGAGGLEDFILTHENSAASAAGTLKRLLFPFLVHS